MTQEIIRQKISDLESKLFEYQVNWNQKSNASGAKGARYRKMVNTYFKDEDKIKDRIKKLKEKLI